jgi:hypothetical protein
VRLQTVPVRTVLEVMEAEVPTRLVLLDACRDNPLARARGQKLRACGRHPVIGAMLPPAAG